MHNCKTYILYFQRSELIREGGTLRMVKISQLMPVSNENERKEQVSLEVNHLDFDKEIQS